MYNSRNIDELRSDVKYNCIKWINKCLDNNLKVLITGTVRDNEYQEYCYNNGTSKSKIPTFHSIKAGLAFDFCKNIKGHEYDDIDFFNKCGKIAKDIGFEWGGDWKTFIDRPHIQWSGTNYEYNSSDIIKGNYPYEMSKYDDLDNSPYSFEYDAVMWAINNNLIKGDDTGNLKLHSYITKAEILIILYRYDAFRSTGK